MKKLSANSLMLMVLTLAWLFQPLESRSLAADSERISLEEFKKLFESDADMVIVDTRPIKSYNEGHIPGAISMTYSHEIRARHQELPRDKTIILYCS